METGSSKITTSILVFMIYNSCKAEDIKSYLFEVIEGLQNIWLKPVNFVFDHIVYFENKLVSWKDIEYLYELDSILSLRCALQNLHMYIQKPDKLQSMKVKYTTQIFSNTLGSVLNRIYSSGLVDQSKVLTMPNTFAYLLFFNDIFDLFNSSNYGKAFFMDND